MRTESDGHIVLKRQNTQLHKPGSCNLVVSGHQQCSRTVTKYPDRRRVHNYTTHDREEQMETRLEDWLWKA